MASVLRRVLWLAVLWLGPAAAFAQNQAPVIFFTSPATGSAYEATATVFLRVAAADPDGTITKVEYYANGALLGALTTPPFSANLTIGAPGTYSLVARAFDNAGATTTSSPAVVTVYAANAGNAAPSVSLASPLNGSTYTAPASLLMYAGASDANGTINRVEYYLNGVFGCVRTTAPYGCALAGLPVGTHALTARAFDNQGKAATSSAVLLSVLNSDPANVAPTITLWSPVSNAVSAAPAAVWLRVNAADGDGAVNRVEYFANGALLALTNTPPYGINWTGVGAGTYSVVARVWDNKGASADSAPSTVTVNNPVGGNASPTVSLLLPINASTYEAPAAFDLVANAADSDGTINRVEFYFNGNFYGVATAAPYALAAINAPAGTYAWTATAFDNQGASTTSTGVTTVVSAPNASNTAPSVSLSQPVDNAVYAAPAAIPVSISASDPDGSVNRVEVFVNGGWVGTFTALPYEVTLTGSPAGAYAIAARAWDDLGKSATAAAANVTVVNNAPPTVSIGAPVNGAVYPAPGSVTITATAADSDGAVSRVEFYRGAALIGTATAAPYAATDSGLASGSYSYTARAYDNFNAVATSAAVNVIVNAPPNVALTSPSPGASLTAPATVALGATASDPDGTIGRVEFYRGATLVATVTAAPYAASDASVAAGSYSYTARAYDNSGGMTISAAVSVTVSDNAAPAVSITAPAGGTVYQAPASIGITASASDSDGSISRVEFYSGATLVGTATAAPYAITWANAAAGSYALTARAYDNLNATTTSAAVNVVVNAAPAVSITAPASGIVVGAPATVNLAASASDTDGTIARVEFYRGATLFATAATAPYAATDSNVRAGAYSYTARAYDNNGGITTSAAITVISDALPTVAIAAPASGAVYQAPGNITLTASAADSDGTISKVEFYNGATLIGAAATAPYTYNWTNVASGSYAIIARAYDNHDLTTTSAAVNVTVNAAPTVAITAPANNSVFAPPGTVNLTATAADSDGAIGKVEFYRGATLVATATAAPYAATDSGLASGSYGYTARAYDNNGGITTSAAVNVVVNTLPTVSITAPADKSLITPPEPVNLTAVAADSDGTISKVEFYRGALLIATATAAPYAATDPAVPAGTHSYTARAYDNDGGITTSAAVGVVVKAAPVVTITAPANGAVYQLGEDVVVTATASDLDGAIRKVEFYRGATLVATATAPPFSQVIPGLAAGTHELSVKAYDDQNALGTAGPINVIVNAPPTLSITAPANNAVLAAPANVTLRTNAADSDGTISRVEFYNGSTRIETVSAAPFDLPLTNLPAGPYTFTARAFDDNGGVATSAPVILTVSGSGAAMPVIYQYDELGRLIGVQQ